MRHEASQTTRRGFIVAVGAGIGSITLLAGSMDVSASAIPIAGLIVNLSSVAVVWLAADRIASGDLKIGSLIAFLTYITQVLFSVVMATFIAAIAPRAIVSSDCR